MPTAQTYGAGFYVDLSDMGDHMSIANVVFKEEGAVRNVGVDAIYAPVSGSMILGTVAGNLSMVDHLKSIQVIPQNNVYDTVVNNLDLVKVINCYRLFGHDVTLYDHALTSFTVPWANARHCIIEPACVFFDPKRPKTYSIERSHPRSGRYDPITPIIELLRSGGATFSVTKPTLAPTEWMKWREPLRIHITTRVENKARVEFKVPATFGVNPCTFSSHRYETITHQDFRSTRSEARPLFPEGKHVVHPSDIETVAVAERSVPAQRVASPPPATPIRAPATGDAPGLATTSLPTDPPLELLNVLAQNRASTSDGLIGDSSRRH
jgi:hypothetical protein